MPFFRPSVSAAMRRLPLIAALALSASSCSDPGQDGPIKVGIIGEPDSLYEAGLRLSPASQHVRAATTEGLVTLDQAGRILPAIAERWHISPDGLYYTFKLRDTSWPDEDPVTADDVRTILRDTKRELEGTTLGLDLAKLTEIRAMTGRVIELRLSSPMPEFLRLLAQPELGLIKNGSGSGPMVLARDDEEGLARLSALPLENRGLPARQNWEEYSRPLTIRALPAAASAAAFSNGEIDLLLNGHLTDLPRAELGPLSRGTIQVDPTLGLFGLAFLHSDGLFETSELREALSMAINRDALIEPFGISGWQPTSWIVPASLFEAAGYPAARWSNLNIEGRRTIAATRIAAWSDEAETQAIVRVRMPQGPGNAQLFTQLEQAWRAIGVTTVRVTDNEAADLELRDRIARYSSPRWFLNQFNCGLELGLCSPATDALVEASTAILDPDAKAQVLADAHTALVDEEVFIAFGAPVRWSLVRGTIAAYEPNPWGLHPLFPLSQSTN